VIHRDVKPSNVMVEETERGVQATLMDFGLVKAMESSESLTAAGTILGSPEYMAPEQADPDRKSEIGPATDRYALGVVAYEMLTGRVPFDADSPLAVMRGHADKAPPNPQDIRKDMPKSTAQVLLKALSKSSAERYPTAMAMVEALRQPQAEEAAGEAARKAAEEAERQRAEAERRAQAEAERGAKEEAERRRREWLAAEKAQAKEEARLIERRAEEARPAQKMREVEPQRPVVAQPARTRFPTWGWVAMGVSVLALLIGGVWLVQWVLSQLVPTSTPFPGVTRVWDEGGSVMVYVPAGKFWMGSSDADIDAILAECSECKREWYTDEQPQHEVYPDAFWIDRTEVTNGQYRLCVADGACSPPLESTSYTRDSYYGDTEFDNYPVIYVNWSQAKAYCTWAGKRLPTEAEWEKAARGTDGRIYPWGEEIDCNRANYWGKAGICVGDTTEVGSYPAGTSPYGALDMAGNVWEWVADWYSSSYYASLPDSNPQGPDSGAGRVVRGGSWHHDQRGVRAAYRLGREPSHALSHVGFRCARSGSGS